MLCTRGVCERICEFAHQSAAVGKTRELIRESLASTDRNEGARRHDGAQNPERERGGGKHQREGAHSVEVVVDEECQSDGHRRDQPGVEPPVGVSTLPGTSAQQPAAARNTEIGQPSSTRLPLTYVPRVTSSR